MNVLLVVLLAALVVVGFVLWLLLDGSLVRIAPGRLGLVLLQGTATDRVLLPGLRFAPAFRQVLIQEFPSNELSYRAGEPPDHGPPSDLERAGPPLRVSLPDGTEMAMCCTVRFRLEPTALRQVHERFGPDGIWSAVRDTTSKTIGTALRDGHHEVEEFVGGATLAFERDLGAVLDASLAAAGFTLTSFAIGAVDLGRTGEVIQATSRARFELARELAEADLRVTRGSNDAKLQAALGGGPVEVGLRYREVDAWREVAAAIARSGLVPAGLPRAAMASADGPGAAGDASAGDGGTDR